ncbi:barstar family protein [Psychromicrobium lacuslunae]|uniref:barstar family protein n=1 Tax=Psychromicrobium lacuslunae TaxID=1618207 RepID=UPI0005D3DEA6|nr:barstar family protein [Psychromicrobium lacuslunae]
MSRNGQRPVFEVPAARSKQGVLKAFAEALDFPAYFGHNLDALHDSLHDFADGLSEPSTLVWHIDPWFKNSQAYRSVLMILRELESEKLRVEARDVKRLTGKGSVE